MLWNSIVIVTDFVGFCIHKTFVHKIEFSNKKF